MIKTITQISAIFILGIMMLSCTNSQTNETNKEVKAPSKTIHEATFFGDLEAVNQHIAFGTDLNQKDEYGSTPLNVAITFGKNEIAKALIEGGADLTVTSADGSTPLHTASLFGRVETVELLLSKGIEMEVKNTYGSTPYTTVSAPFEQMKPVYDELSRDLGPFGFKLEYDVLQVNREAITKILGEALNAQNN